MIWQQDRLFLSKTANEVLTAYLFVKENSTEGEVDQCDTIGEVALGVCSEAAVANQKNVRVTYSGVELVTAGGVVAIGDAVKTDASGRAIKQDGSGVILGKALSASAAAGNLISVQLLPSVTGLGGVKTLRVPITRVAAATEQDTGYDLPTKCVVLGVWLDIATAEATGGTKTIDVGTLSSASGDADGFLDGVSVAATGLVKGTLLSSGQTLGALLRTDESGAGVLVPEPSIACGGKSITYTLGSDDFAELVGDIVIALIDLT